MYKYSDTYWQSRFLRVVTPYLKFRTENNALKAPGRYQVKLKEEIYNALNALDLNTLEMSEICFLMHSTLNCQWFLDD